jgi:hypothetical protein
LIISHDEVSRINIILLTSLLAEGEFKEAQNIGKCALEASKMANHTVGSVEFATLWAFATFYNSDMENLEASKAEIKALLRDSAADLPFADVQKQRATEFINLLEYKCSDIPISSNNDSYSTKLLTFLWRVRLEIMMNQQIMRGEIPNFVPKISYYFTVLDGSLSWYINSKSVFDDEKLLKIRKLLKYALDNISFLPKPQLVDAYKIKLEIENYFGDNEELLETFASLQKRLQLENNFTRKTGAETITSDQELSEALSSFCQALDPTKCYDIEALDLNYARESSELSKVTVDMLSKYKSKIEQSAKQRMLLMGYFYTQSTIYAKLMSSLPFEENIASTLFFASINPIRKSDEEKEIVKRISDKLESAGLFSKPPDFDVANYTITLYVHNGRISNLYLHNALITELEADMEFLARSLAKNKPNDEQKTRWLKLQKAISAIISPSAEYTVNYSDKGFFKPII